MKRNYLNILTVVLGAIIFSLTACQPDKYELGSVIAKEALKYSITQDADDPNMIILKSENFGMTPLWVTPMGRSTRVQDTIRLPFEGEYQFIYGIQSAGGFIQADTFKLTVTTNNLNYVKDELWTLLTGGVGNEKTWLLDLDADGKSKHFAGPLYFYGTDDSWETITKGEKLEDADSWSWEADWPGNQWIMPEGDYGTMTFSLKGNATIFVDHKMLGKQENGTYFLDASSKTLKMTDASPLHDENRDGQVVDWGKIKVLALTEDYMQLGVLRDAALSGEGEVILSYNFISKKFSDAYKEEPEPEVDPEPQLPDGWEMDVSQIVSNTITWKLSTKNPVDWANLDGSRMNGWNVPEDYPDWLGTPDPSVYEGFSLTMNSSDASVIYVAPDGTEQEGTFELDEKGVYTFTGINPDFSIINWVHFGLSADNQLRILSIEKNELGQLSGMWLGAISSEKPEYTAFHLIPSLGSGGDAPDVSAAVKNMLTSKTWKIDSERSYDVATSWGAEQGPVIFSDYATWSYNPMPGEQYGAGEVGIDYGTMKFNADGTILVKQRVRKFTYLEDGETLSRNGLPEDGDELASEEVEELNGTWTFDYDTKKLTISVAMLHPWTANYAVANWGDTQVYKIESDALLLQVMRSEELSGEGAMPMTYVFVPVSE